MTKRYTHSSATTAEHMADRLDNRDEDVMQGLVTQAHLCRWAEVIIENPRPLVGLSLASVVLRTRNGSHPSRRIASARADTPHDEPVCQGVASEASHW
jgi:hypothetical protein